MFVDSVLDGINTPEYRPAIFNITHILSLVVNTNFLKFIIFAYDFSTPKYICL